MRKKILLQSELPVVSVLSLKKMYSTESLHSSVLFNELYDMFQTLTPVLLQELRAAWNRKEFYAVQQLAHRLKSAALYVGAVRLGEICDSIECSDLQFEVIDQAIVLELLEQSYKDANYQLGELLKS